MLFPKDEGQQLKLWEKRNFAWNPICSDADMDRTRTAHALEVFTKNNEIIEFFDQIAL